VIARLFAAVLVAVLASGIARADPVKIRADWAIIPSQFAPLIPTVSQYAPNVYRHYGKSYVVEPLHMQGGGATLTALAVGETDLSTLSPQTLVLGIVNAKLELRVIGQEVSSDIPGYLHTHFWVHGSEIKTIDDLKGRIIGVSVRNSNVDSAAHMIMARHGFTEPRDYQILEIPFPAQFAALEAHKIDAAILVPPFHLMAATDPELKPIFGTGDAFGPVETLMWIAKADYVAAHRAALVDLLEDNMRMRRWMTDPKTRMDAVRQLADTTKVPVAAFADWVYTTGDLYYEPHAMVDVARLQKNVDDMKRAGIVPAAIAIAPYVDMSLAREAAARLQD
jgi:sulfonate transport system substrate-binding protein